MRQALLADVGHYVYVSKPHIRDLHPYPRRNP
jgi:hypothetical protein